MGTNERRQIVEEIKKIDATKEELEKVCIRDK